MEGLDGLRIRRVTEQRCDDSVNAIVAGRAGGGVVATLHKRAGSVGIWAYPQCRRACTVEFGGKTPIALAVGGKIAVLLEDSTVRVVDFSGETVAVADLETNSCEAMSDDVPQPPEWCDGEEQSCPPATTGVVSFAGTSSLSTLLFAGAGDTFRFVEHASCLVTPVDEIVDPTSCAEVTVQNTWRGVVGCADGAVHLLSTSALLSSHTIGDASSSSSSRAVRAACVSKGNAFFAQASGCISVYSTQGDELSFVRVVDVVSMHGGGGIRSLSCPSDASLLLVALEDKVRVYRRRALVSGAVHAEDTHDVSGALSSACFVPLLVDAQHGALKDPDFKTSILVSLPSNILVLECTDPNGVWMSRAVFFSILLFLAGAAVMTFFIPGFAQHGL
eukprot:Rhum_TRINITY_DN13278_c0_g1::Rhum_TRINITY_DN13278_c0_g1_i1::g.58609::m.58609